MKAIHAKNARNDGADKRFKNTTRSPGSAAFDQNKPSQSTIPAQTGQRPIKVLATGGHAAVGMRITLIKE
ncbi:hypothetical protein GTP45_20490 [Pseudoduganella sp. FT55W]|uniref:Uncharacterized protein n=1 Tax=Duganella rivi TaxID=2666083 RepID=A0A7X4GU55_9BURK|nr:hypothetical protein [Duganella rivi]MYM69199.1 hypothetical protein [Duganella rivi]